MKKCGYSFWGYLGDVKYDKQGDEVSTPDGNAFYSWCIIRELQKRGYEVTQIMPDRDKKGFEIHDSFLFASWLQTYRTESYIGTCKVSWDLLDDIIKDLLSTGDSIHEAIRKIKYVILDTLEMVCDDMEFILHEYRMLIPGRNDKDSILNEGWQPDYLIQECLFEYCCKEHKRLILFDLDYKLDDRIYRQLREDGCSVVVFELGTRWDSYFDIKYGIEHRHVYIPFDFSQIDFFDIKTERKNNLIYIGNRYERDWCIDKYIPEDLDKCTIYGNWLEGSRDSDKRWKSLRFGKRLQTRDMRDVYNNSKVTILLAKKEYCEYGFMTARIIESIFYGTVPLFIEEYGEDVIKEYAGKYASYLTVRNKEDVKYKIFELRNNSKWMYIIIEYLREHLKFMDVKYFVDTIEEVK